MSLYQTVNPMTGDVVREYPTMKDEEVQPVLERAGAAFEHWSDTDVADRAAVLTRIAELHREHADELAQLMTLEMGKPVAQAKGEVELAASIYEYYAQSGPAMIADEELETSGPGRAIVRTAPIGPVVGVMPWNFPYYQVARFVAPNLLLGNTVVLKHAPSCPQQAERIEAMVAEAGAPEGVYTNVFATNEQVAQMIASPIVQGVSLTGSERAGTAIGEAAGRHLKKCVLELGGSDPLLVLAGADVPRAAKAAAVGRFANAGQACTAAKRIIVESQVWDDFVPRFLEAAKSWQCGDPMAPETRMGPMSSAAARDNLVAQVEDAVAKGAEVLVGGEVPEGPATFYPPTVITGVTPEMRAHQEELFGPVAVLHKVDSVDEAVAVANDTPYGLGSAVFTEDEAVADDVAARLQAGMVGINTTVRTAPDLPFGGVKRSGVGRELGRFGLDEFSNKKLINRK
ncbi:MAG TPA: NAD-dependent succinate-semialdehyde dehydrogenase [Marmoricola sp.]|nr:NAD-dependent succinate-semialdehyde dehydrogenase [Marmoricola sp.]